jgi:EpsI family protein
MREHHSSKSVNRRTATAWLPTVLACAAGVLLLVAAGAGYRVLAYRLDRTLAGGSFPRGTLAALPFEIGEWTGRDEPLDESIVEATDLDDYVNRWYVRRTDGAAVGLWLAFGSRARDLMPHRPEVCYPGAGWTLEGQNTTVLHPRAGSDLRVRILDFTRGGLDPRQLTVLNYYIVDGETCEDVSLLRSKAWRGQTSVKYTAQVQITCRESAARTTASPGNLVRAFAVDSFAEIMTLLDRSVDSVDRVDLTDRP